MKKRSKLMLMLLFSATSLPLTANAEASWYLETDTQASVAMQDVEFLLAADDDTHFSVVAKNDVVYDNVTKATFTKKDTDPGGVQQVGRNQLSVLSTQVQSTLSISGLHEGSTIKISSINGQVVITAHASERETTIDVSKLAPGYYLLSAGKSTVKFIKR